MQDDVTRAAIEDVSKKLLAQLMADPVVLEQLSILLRRAITQVRRVSLLHPRSLMRCGGSSVQENNKDALYILLSKLVHDPATINLLSKTGAKAVHQAGPALTYVSKAQSCVCLWHADAG